MTMRNYLRFMLLFVLNTSLLKASEIELSKYGGYEGLVIGISPYVPKNSANEIITAIKGMINEASLFLYGASGNRLTFKEVQILIPDSWDYDEVDDMKSNLNFKDSHIRIDEMDPNLGLKPNTIQHKGCGESGKYIHITPQFLLDEEASEEYGLKGKLLVREWAKYRWGVFEEIGYKNNDQHPFFYPSNNDKRYKPNYCAGEELTGVERDIVTNEECSLNEYGLPDENCRFIPNLKQNTKSSLMAFSKIYSITHFCGFDESTPHNMEAPTKHNLMCQRKSVWDIMKQHSDFKLREQRDLEPGKPLPSIPNIKVVKQSVAHYCLVLDYSDSMRGSRIEKLKATARRWIMREVDVGSWVGIIRFSNSATLSRQLTEITNQESREILTNALYYSPQGSTCIGCGLRLAVKSVLNESQNSVIILLSDAEENRKPFINETKEELITAGVRVISIAMGNEADPNLEELGEITDGRSYYASDLDEGFELIDAFKESLIYQPDSIIDTRLKIHELTTSNINDRSCHEFVVDWSIGRDLTIQFTSSLDELYVEKLSLYSPGSQQATETNSAITIHQAAPGIWKYCVETKKGAPNHEFTVDVTSKPRNRNIPAITVESWVEETDDWLAVIYAEVKEGTKPVLDVQARALILNIEKGERMWMTLYDNGEGADITENDGIYSGYFTHIKNNGRYSVSTKVSREEEDSNEGSRRKRQIFGLTSGAFTRLTTAGSFQIQNYTQSYKDKIPPSRVRDLTAEIFEDKLILEWTTSGDDFNLGIASKYEIKMSTRMVDLWEENFESETAKTIIELSSSEGKHDNIFQEGGKRVILEMEFEEELEESEIYYIALQAKDEESNKSPVSNVATVMREVDVATAGWIITLIVLGSILGILALAALVIYILRRPRFKIVPDTEQAPSNENEMS